MDENEDWEILSDSSKSDCNGSQPYLLNRLETYIPSTCIDTPSCLPIQSEPQDNSENESSCSLSDSYSSMPPLIESTDSINLPNDVLLLDSEQEVVESNSNTLMTLSEYIAVISLLELRQCKKIPVKKETKHVKHVAHRPMTRLYRKQLSESMAENSTIPTRPMTRLYRKQFEL